jgi:hypothetical protein
MILIILGTIFVGMAMADIIKGTVPAYVAFIFRSNGIFRASKMGGHCYSIILAMSISDFL